MKNTSNSRRQHTEGVRTAAECARRMGLSVLPICFDGSKAPTLQSWDRYKHTIAEDREITNWFRDNRVGLGVIGGKVSGGLEWLDFDTKEMWHAFQGLADEASLGDLVRKIADGYLEETPKGFHLGYRCANPRNRELAKRPSTPEELAEKPKGKFKILIENKGEGGYCIVAPSCGGVHPSGEPYVLLSGGFDEIVEITDEEHEQLLRIARMLDQRPPPEDGGPESTGAARDQGRPGDESNARSTWSEILEPHGWTLVNQHGPEGRWRRPGKNDPGISATTDHFPGIFKCFSTSTEFDTERGYRKFAVYTILNHGGDFSAAAADLAAKGFGCPVPEARAESPLEDFSEDGMARRFVRLHGDAVRHVPRWKRWLVWDETRWVIDEEHRSRDLVRLTVTDGFEESVERFRREQSDEAKKGMGVALRLRRAAPMQAILWMAASDQLFVIHHEDLDTDPWLLNVGNGTLDLHAGRLREHRRADRITKLAPVPFDPEATAPLFMEFLERVQPDPEIQSFLQRAVGYSLTGDTREEVVFINHGGGANGKTTLVETLRSLLGDYSIAMPAETVLRSKGSSIPNDVANLPGRRFATVVETPEDRKLDEERIKALASGDQMTARFMRGEWFEFRPRAKFWLATNHRPSIFGDDDGIWRRIRLIPWQVQIHPDDQDRTLRDRLKAELPGILAWAVRGCLEWQEKGLAPPESVLVATATYRAEEDPFGAFLEERCVMRSTQFVSNPMLREALEDWCKTNGHPVPSTKAMASRLRMKGCEPKKVGSSRGWKGIDLAAAHSGEETDSWDA